MIGGRQQDQSRRIAKAGGPIGDDRRAGGCVSSHGLQNQAGWTIEVGELCVHHALVIGAADDDGRTENLGRGGETLERVAQQRPLAGQGVQLLGLGDARNRPEA